MDLLYFVASLVTVAVIALSLVQVIRHRWSKRSAALVSVVAALPTILLSMLVGWTYCTAIGCESRARVTVSLAGLQDYPVSLRICVDKTELLCVNDTLETPPVATDEDERRQLIPGAFCVADICVTPLKDRYVVDYNRLSGENHTVRLQVDEVRSGEESIRTSWFIHDQQDLKLKSWSPNGEDCGSPCWSGNVTFEPAYPQTATPS